MVLIMIVNIATSVCYEDWAPAGHKEEQSTGDEWIQSTGLYVMKL